MPYQLFFESRKSQVVFLFRQLFQHNLYDRLSTRPFLTAVEKKWVAYQLLRVRAAPLASRCVLLLTRRPW